MEYCSETNFIIFVANKDDRLQYFGFLMRQKIAIRSRYDNFHACI